MYRDHKIALVIPAKNEERLIRPTLEEAPSFIDKIYAIDDGSTDSTPQVILEIAAKNPRVQLIRHEINRGVGQAIITGYLQSSLDNYDITVVVGGDFQMPYEQTSRLLDPIIDGKADYTKGNRFLEGGKYLTDMPRLRFFANTVISMLTKIASGYYKVFDVVDGFTAISKRAIDVVDWDKAWKGYGYPMDFLVRLNAYKLKTIDIPRRAVYLKGEKQSQIKGFKYFLKVSPMLLKDFFWRLFYKYFFLDFHILLFFYLAGMLFLPMGLIFGLFLVYRQIAGIGVSGPQSVLCALFILIGLQFLLFAMLFDMQEGS